MCGHLKLSVWGLLTAGAGSSPRERRSATSQERGERSYVKKLGRRDCGRGQGPSPRGHPNRCRLTGRVPFSIISMMSASCERGCKVDILSKSHRDDNRQTTGPGMTDQGTPVEPPPEGFDYFQGSLELPLNDQLRQTCIMEQQPGSLSCVPVPNLV